MREAAEESASSSTQSLEPPLKPQGSDADQDIADGFQSFSHLLDTRVLRALASLGFVTPTLVQQKAIPLALSGKDILARARTGSGKTLAYGLTVLQKAIQAKAALSRSDPAYQATRALILVPTRELSEQVTAQIGALLEFCRDQISIANIARDASSQVQKLLLSEKPDIVVSTPSRALTYLQSKSLNLSETLESLVIDEADLILSYGHDDDVRALLGGGFLPKVFQSFLMSATMTADVQKLKGLVMRNPAILRLEEDASTASNLSQYVVRVSEEDKFLLVYVILKLRLIRGKCILFVNDVDRCYRLKLFMEQFGLKACVLNAELPINSRFHIVQEFNKGVYDYIIATDESSIKTAEKDDGQEEEEEEEEEEEKEKEEDDGQDEKAADKVAEAEKEDSQGSEAEDGDASKKKKRKRKDSDDTGKEKRRRNGSARRKSSSSAEYGVSRGIDFVAVSCVINFDLPTSSRSYIHRVGRTARAGNTGTALSFVVPRKEWGKKKVISCPTAEGDEEVWKRIEDSQRNAGGVKVWKYDAKQVEGFRYRMEDALRSVTRAGIREARIKEIKQEILNSEKLKAHFEDNPTDLEYLRHDKALHPSRVQSHMKHIPTYLRPRISSIKSNRNPNHNSNNNNMQEEDQGSQAEGGKSDVPRDDTGRPLGYIGLKNQKSNGSNSKLGGRIGARLGPGGGRGGARGRGNGRGGRGGGSSGGRKKSDPLRKFGK
ncbi:DEAD-domain-containing protein [Violaceomyces palustris]|uniref:DEAD-domain-containing protein n=1 Tax=Violaceomyces palustris TaxID=1673888 RepID=A0ACD0NVG8_9BASI|nr:DEAD-domain-containing protein [Violaceomyces palustris]